MRKKEIQPGKLTKSPAEETGVGVPTSYNRLCIYDINTRERFLVDTGAEISVLAVNHKRKPIPCPYKLYAANNTPIQTYGQRTIRLDLGLRRNFIWTFIVADVKTSILGADFLRHYKLLVDLHHKKLRDGITNLSIKSVDVTCKIETVNIISSDQTYYDILKNYPEVFRPMSLKTPAKHNVTHHIVTTGSPLFARPRPLPPDKYKMAKEEFERMIQMGICQPSESPWASPLHIVTKKDGGLRVCGDYRRLNAVTQPDRYPIPRVQDFTYQLHGMKIFSKLDLKMAYYWIPISKEDAQKTAIITPFGLFEFKCMTFGLRNASQTFQRFMHEVLRGIEGCYCFVDDILIFAKNEENHKTVIKEVLRRLEKYGVTLNVEKCEFGKSKINFLGYQVSSEGISPTKERTETIANYPKPKTVAELRRFLGMLNFYRDCLPHQAEMQAPLNTYLHNTKKNDKTPIEWTEKADQAFEQCRKSILEATTLTHPVPGTRLCIMSDASDHSVGAALHQDVNGTWHPLSFFSKAMSPTQRRYSVYDRELLAIYMSVKHFRRLIEGNDVIVFTDHKPLVHALTRPPNNSDSPRRERQLHFISQFCSSIEYIHGAENPVADALSRIQEIQCPSYIDYANLSADQHEDEELRKLRQQSNLRFSQISLPGIPRPITCEMSTGAPRPYLPKSYRFEAFKAQHDMCHPGVRATRSQVANKYFWPTMNKQVGEWTKACTSCQRAKVHRHVVTPIGSLPSSQRFDHIHIDIIGPLQPSKENRYCVTIIDRCTKWPEAVPVRDITAETVARALYESWISRFGCPLRITTDQGKQFESALFKSLLKIFGINRIRTTAFHPQSNGQIERWHRTLKAALIARGGSTTWTDELPTVLLGLRTTIRNDMSPAMMTYGSTLRIPSDFFMPTQLKVDDADYVRSLVRTMTSLSPSTRTNTQQSKPFIHKELANCTHVFVRNDTVRKPLIPPYDGPYEVIKRYEKYYKLQLPNRTSVISMDRLKPAFILREDDDDRYAGATQPKPDMPYVTRSGRVSKPTVRFA